VTTPRRITLQRLSSFPLFFLCTFCLTFSSHINKNHHNDHDNHQLDRDRR
jgi:hypothetical protein